MYIFYFLAALSIWFGIQSLLSGFRYAGYVRRETSRALPDFHPFVSVIAPSRGLDVGLQENVRALLNQDYPAYEILFVFDRSDDPAVAAIAEIKSRIVDGSRVRTKMLIAGPAVDSGQKVHNLQHAVNDLDPNSEVLAFVDTDARPGQNWLRQLVAPLADKNLGASTGYRWFIPQAGGIASRLRSVWNAAVASALGSERDKNFCWGGSTAITRATFERLNICERWHGSVSDDFTLTHLIQQAKLPIYYSPHCLVPSLGDCDFHEFLEFTTRQIKITRVYAPHLWKPILFGGLLFAIVFFGGLLLIAIRAAAGGPIFIPAVLLAVVFLLGAAKSLVRWQAVRIPLAQYHRQLRRDLAGQLLLWPFASLVYLYNAIVAAFSRRIQWRGITYELKSANEAVIISRDS